MRTIFLSALLLVGACTQIGGVNSAGTKAATAANNLYYHASKSCEKLIEEKVVAKEVCQKYDNQAYAIVLDIRAGKATLDSLRPVLALLSSGGK